MREEEIAREMALTPGVSRKTVVLRIAKRRERARMSLADRSALRKVECAACRNKELLMGQVRVDGKKGCWIWTGPFVAAISGRARPMIRVGQYGRGYADLIMYELTKGKPLPKGCFLKSGCGDNRCIRPDHQAVTNTPVERARKRQGGDDEQQKGMAHRKAG